MEEKTTNELLDEEIRSRLENLIANVPGSEDDTNAIDNLVKLQTLKTAADQVQQKERDAELRAETAMVEARERANSEKLKAVLETAGKVLQVGAEIAIGLVVIGFNRESRDIGYEFEKDGDIVTSPTFKETIRSFPRIKLPFN